MSDQKTKIIQENIKTEEKIQRKPEENDKRVIWILLVWLALFIGVMLLGWLT